MSLEKTSPYAMVHIPGHEPFDLLALECALNLSPPAVLSLGYIIRGGEREGGGATLEADYRKAIQCLERGIEIHQSEVAEGMMKSPKRQRLVKALKRGEK